jgi:hypothetical protein
MAHDIRLIRLEDFLRTDVHGQFDMTATKELLSELSKEVAQHPHHHILLDLRDARSHLVVPELYALVAHLSDLGLGVNNRIALLYHQKDSFDRARFFALYAEKQGLQVGAFQDFEWALEWLQKADA